MNRMQFALILFSEKRLLIIESYVLFCFYIKHHYNSNTKQDEQQHQRCTFFNLLSFCPRHQKRDTDSI